MKSELCATRSPLKVEDELIGGWQDSIGRNWWIQKHESTHDILFLTRGKLEIVLIFLLTNVETLSRTAVSRLAPAQPCLKEHI